MGLISLGTRFGTRFADEAATILGSSTAAAGATGAAGGLILDDIPILKQLDPTEGGNGGGMNLTLILVLVVVLVVAWKAGEG